MKVDGHCHCGEITFEAEVDPDAVNICHCTDCQTLSGTAFRINIPAPAEHFVLLSGTPKRYIKTAESGNKRLHAFCGNCGTPIYACAVGQSAELWLACRDNYAARGLLTEATRLAAVCAALGGCARCGSCDRERVDGLNRDYFTKPQFRLTPYHQPDIVPPI